MGAFMGAAARGGAREAGRGAEDTFNDRYAAWSAAGKPEHGFRPLVPGAVSCCTCGYPERSMPHAQAAVALLVSVSQAPGRTAEEISRDVPAVLVRAGYRAASAELATGLPDGCEMCSGPLVAGQGDGNTCRGE